MPRNKPKPALSARWAPIAAAFLAVAAARGGGDAGFWLGAALCVAVVSWRLARLALDAAAGKRTAPRDWLASALCAGLLVLLFANIRSGDIRAMPDEKYGRFLTPGVVLLYALPALCVWLRGADALARLPVRLVKKLYALQLLLSPFFCFAICELACNTSPDTLRPFSVALNLALWALLEIVLAGLPPTPSSGLIPLYLFALWTGAVNHYLIVFRSTPLMAVDMLSLWAAKAVCLQYSYRLTSRLALSLVSAFACVGAALALDAALGPFARADAPRRRRMRAGAAVAFAVGAAWVLGVDFEKAYGIPLLFPRTMYAENGALVAFITSYHNMKRGVEPPPGYTPEGARAVLEAYAPRPAKGETKPDIIVVMNESFSDLSALGPLECTRRHLKYYNSLADDPGTLEYGTAYASTLGGGTAKTEFEYLTGFSIAWMPGSIPYNQYDFTRVPTIAKELAKMGYATVAMHPESPYNWRRNIVYPAMGFERSVFLDGFEGYARVRFKRDAGAMWARVSDAGDYEKLLDALAECPRPAFIFNVTMQNHGGYDIDVFEPDDRVHVDERYDGDGGLRAYETFLTLSDAALRGLIDRLRKIERPVVLCFFGDHQPLISEEFRARILSEGREPGDTDLSVRQKEFAVPYFIWTNSPELRKGRETPLKKSVAGVGYLGASTLARAGLPLSDYGTFLLALKERVPAINETGWMDVRGTWNPVGEGRAPRELKEFEMVQYYRMFGPGSAE